MFLDEFTTFLSLLLEVKGLIILFGDLNINLLNDDNKYSNKFHTIIDSFNLMQLIKNSTHIKGGLLDLVIISKGDQNSIISSNVCKDFKTDHYPIIASLKDDATYKTKLVKFVREFHKCDVETFVDDVKKSCLNKPQDFMQMSVDEAVFMYNKTFIDLMNRHCPYVRKTYRENHKQSRWYNLELQNLKKQRRKAERNFKKRPTEENKILLIQARNKYNTGWGQPKYKQLNVNCEKSIAPN